MWQLPFLCNYTLLLVLLIPVMADQGTPRYTYVRSPAVRALYNNILDQNRHKNDNHEYWYSIEDKLPADICGKFMQFHQDEETSKFLENCFEKAEWVFTQMFHAFVRPVLHLFMSQTTVNGLLNRGSMFVFSSQQFQQLLSMSIDGKAKKLLDIGAGDGMVTKYMEPYFEQIYATEVSSTMIYRLKNKGYEVLDIDGWTNGEHEFDVISCLNILDRCDRPMTMLYDMKQSLSPGGKLIIASVLPMRPYVESNPDNKPSEHIRVVGDTFEEQVTYLVNSVFEPAGFTVESFTRLPYLCEGDLRKSFYVLDDAVFVLRPS